MANVRITDLSTITAPVDTANTYMMTDDASNAHKISLDELFALHGHGTVGYIVTVPTTGYTSGSVTVWGETKTLYSVTVSTDKDGNPLTNFVSGMKEDYALNVTGSASDFAKLYAHEIGTGTVTFYMTSAPSSAFNVLIKEAI